MLSSVEEMSEVLEFGFGGPGFGPPPGGRGGPTTGPNWPTFLQFADRYLKGPAAAAPVER